MGNLSLLMQVLLTWLFYNAALIFVLVCTCSNFNHNEYETILAMAVFSLGLSVMQYDWWALRNDKYKKCKRGVIARNRVGR